jgi:phosphoribosylamine---glycine ligase
VLAAEGYPGNVTTGDEITGADAEQPEGVEVFQAGTRRDERGRLVSAGGRVLTVCALGDGLAAARDRAYAALSRVSLRGGHYRRDIGVSA